MVLNYKVHTKKKFKEKETEHREKSLLFSNPKLWLTTEILDNTSALWVAKK